DQLRQQSAKLDLVVNGLQFAGSVHDSEVPRRHGHGGFLVPRGRYVAMRSAKHDDRRVFAIEGLTLRIVTRDVPENAAVLAFQTVDKTRDVGDAQRRSGGNEVDEGELAHEVVQELAIVD